MMFFLIGVYRRASAAMKGFPGFRDAPSRTNWPPMNADERRWMQSLFPIRGRP
jgi:hypothetical protein